MSSSETSGSLAVLCKLQFVCDQTWDGLRPVGGRDRVRHCNLCGELVHWCDDHLEFQRHVELGRCVALPGRDPNGGAWVGGVGLPYGDDVEPGLTP